MQLLLSEPFRLSCLWHGQELHVMTYLFGSRKFLGHTERM